MEIKLQTTVTDQNRHDFLKKVYPQLGQAKNQLIQLDQIDATTFIMADCCGWHYKSLWPDRSILGLETYYSIKNFKLDQSYVQGIIDDRDYSSIKWPNLIADNCALIFDRSPVLKYRNVNDIVDVMSTAAQHYNPKCIVFNFSTLFIDDSRLIDRIHSLSTLLIPGYIVIEFVYTTTNITIKFKKISAYD
jgi:hypothetical protein